jgi:aryl-alcohol dehydrogenase-like predicted oxidoreductase
MNGSRKGSMNGIPLAMLGRTKLQVTKLGYGAMELRGGRKRLASSDAVARLLNGVLDAGINFVDTSPDYGVSEELIGQHLAYRRSEYYLASKCGCPIDPPPSAAGERPPHVFTRANVRAGVERSLRRMKTEHLDLVQFHISPSRAVLEENESVEELRLLQREGKVRFIGMSGTLPNLTDHIAMGVFDAFQIPYSALERNHEHVIHEAACSGAGIIVRGGVARGLPVAKDEDFARMPDVFRRAIEGRRGLWEIARLDELLDGMTRMDFMLRFTISHPDMTTTIVGTANLDHLQRNAAAARQGPLPEDLYLEAKRRLSTAAAAA